jgi:hypothetical protein
MASVDLYCERTGAELFAAQSLPLPRFERADPYAAGSPKRKSLKAAKPFGWMAKPRRKLHDCL